MTDHASPAVSGTVRGEVLTAAVWTVWLVASFLAGWTLADENRAAALAWMVAAICANRWYTHRQNVPLTGSKQPEKGQA